jgi:hypothetical protein
MKNHIIILSFSLLLISFGSKTEIENDIQKDSSTTVKKTTSTFPADSSKIDLQIFHNIEMIEYCVLLPLNEFKEDYEIKDQVKARHDFKHMNHYQDYDHLVVQGFLINDSKKVKLKDFYERHVKNTLEDGLGVDTSFINLAENYFVVKGYIPNLPTRKFFEIHWLGEDEVVLSVGYEEKGSLLWERRISKILERGISCQ